MTSEAVDITTVLRRMRGGSQAYTVKGSDGRSYVAKFASNPQGTRTLINECIGHWFYRRLGIATPEIRVLRLCQTVIRQAELHFQVGNRKLSVAAGLHFGSQYPVDPEKVAIFDFLPRRCLNRVENLDDFGKAMAIDTLLGQTDSRQCIFFRERSRGKPKLRFIGSMIDHGWIFGGQQWVIHELSQPPKSFHSDVYRLIDVESVCQRVINLIRDIKEVDLYAFANHIPSEWFSDGDHEALRQLLTQVIERAGRLESLVLRHLQALDPIASAKTIPRQLSAPSPLSDPEGCHAG